MWWYWLGTDWLGATFADGSLGVCGGKGAQHELQGALLPPKDIKEVDKLR